VKDRTALVAVAAAMWGLDGLLRKPLATSLSPATVVLWEHLIVVLLIAPALPAAIRAYWRCGARDRVAIAAIGIGSSAIATALFTKAFQVSARTGDFVGPLVMQKTQPLFAVCFAAVVLRERVRPGFAWYAIPALAGSRSRIPSRCGWPRSPSPRSRSARLPCGAPGRCWAGWSARRSGRVS
jgi:hypothetical protein